MIENKKKERESFAIVTSLFSIFLCVCCCRPNGISINLWVKKKNQLTSFSCRNRNMSRHLVRNPTKKAQLDERLLVVNHDWFVPIQVLRRLNSINAENELESLIFPSNESFESHWQLYLEHQTHPPRIRFGLCLLSPRDRCLRADIKLILLTTHGGQVIKEKIFTDHLFFLSKGDPLCSFINEQISPKIYLDIDGDLYQDVLARAKQGTPLNTDDCTILAYVRFLNELDIQPKTKAFDFSRRFTVDWKLTKFQQIIEQINQTRPPSNFDFVKIIINKSNFVVI